MKLEDIGYNEKLEQFRREENLLQFEIGRVIAEHKERYIVKTEMGEFDAEITGNLRYSAQNREDYPAVGDWVALSTFDHDFSIIYKILPRFSIISRQAVGKFGEKQIIATNIDYGLIVQSVNRDFNLNRLERYLTICYSSKIQPIVVITKIDLIDQETLTDLLHKIKTRIDHVSIIALSNETQEGIEELRKLIVKGKTYCLLGSSGVGKSSLINSLSGENHLKTGEISESIDRGKHITTHRELILMVNGAMLIDNPGMREVGITDNSAGVESTFENIYNLAGQCKFSDCTHTSEKGCAILAALETGELDRSAYENYLKMEREKDHYESTIAEKRRKDKSLGKMVKNVIKSKYRDKF
jgi:ribosome biogenesis GTPase